MSWLVTGEESARLAEQEKAELERRKQEQGKAFRYYLKKGEEGGIVFLDGELGSRGYLTPPRYYEHGFIYHRGEHHNIVCPQQTAPQRGDRCPLCEGGDRPALVSLFSVIDLRPYTTKDGQVIPFTRKLFVAKTGTFELLNKLALKRGGLTGCRFDVARNSDKAPGVGDMFDFQEKYSPEVLKEKFTVSIKLKDGTQKTLNYFEPLDYTRETVFRTGEELRTMGFVASPRSVSGSGRQSPYQAGVSRVERSPIVESSEAPSGGEDYDSYL